MDSSKNNVLLIALIVLAFVAGSLWNRVNTLEKGGAAGTGSNNAQVAGAQDTGAGQQAPQAPTELKIAKPSDKDHWKGNKKARYVLVEYSDYECPFCHSFKPTVDQVLKEYGDKVAFIYRDFPLSFHPKAQKSAEAAECAADQGGDTAYYKMHDAIFGAMPDMALTQLPDLAKGIGLDQAKFKNCLDNGDFEQEVKDDQAEGTKAAVAATPTTVIYDMQTGKQKVIEGALPYESVKASLDELIKG